MQTEQGQYGLGDIKPSSPTLKEIADAILAEFRETNSRIYQLEVKVRKYESIFERIFQEEAQSRLGSKQGYEECAKVGYSPMHRIFDTLQKENHLKNAY